MFGIGFPELILIFVIALIVSSKETARSRQVYRQGHGRVQKGVRRFSGVRPVRDEGSGEINRYR